MSTPKFNVTVQLTGQDGNAWNLMGLVIRGMKKAGATAADVKQFQDEAMSGDYDNLLRVCAQYVDVM